MAQINEKQVAELITMNARDYFTIFTVTMERMDALLADYQDVFGRLRVSPTFSDLAAITTTQFIELKRGKNFGAVKIGDNKKEEKPEAPNPEEEKPDFTIRDPDAPMTDKQRRKIEGEMFGFRKGQSVLNDYLTANKVPSIDELNKGQASEVIQELIDAKKSGGDKQ